jgi:hypothetical protein
MSEKVIELAICIAARKTQLNSNKNEKENERKSNKNSCNKKPWKDNRKVTKK